ncbi:MAG: YicC family protein [Clostridia bacterium]|nr:YicC family protein [Clostridia bacterium]
MIKSMTAYGRATAQTSGKNITVDIKSVNNRFFDCSIRISRRYSHLEEKVRAYIQKNATSRGKVDVHISVELLESEGIEMHLDPAYAESYYKALCELRDTFSLKDDISTMAMAQNRDIFTVVRPEEDTEKDWNELSPVLDAAIAEYNDMRSKEGQRISEDLMAKKSRLAELAKQIEALSEQGVEKYRTRLEAKLRATLETMAVEPDEQRILTECAIFADKIAIDEELVRLASHFKAFDEMLLSNEPLAKRIDFLLQEMNREVNTTGSKCNDAEIAHLVVEMKAILEKIREQIQNIE